MVQKLLSAGQVKEGMKVRVEAYDGDLEGVIVKVYCGKDTGFDIDTENYTFASSQWEEDRVYLIEKYTNKVEDKPEYAEAPIKSSEWTDKHYDHYYTHKLTQEEIDSGVVKLKIDPYFVNSLWGLNSVEKSGAGFHCLKTLSRMPNNKNSLSREWDAMIGQSTRAKQLLDE